MTPALPSSTLPPAQPVYVLRGHGAAIHTLLFFRENSRLLTGDADGWIVIWSVATKRPVAVWRAHEATVLGAEIWDEDKLITHGRDGKLCVWSMSLKDEQTMSTQLPIEGNSTHRKQPWLLHTLDIITTNFCSFASCVVPSLKAVDSAIRPETTTSGDAKPTPLLLAVSGANDSQIDLYHLPSEKKVGTIPAPEQVNTKTGMVMALKLFHAPVTSDLHVIAGYESGRTYVFKRIVKSQQWEAIYTSCPHSQAILSLDFTSALDCYFTSSADAIIAKHPLLVEALDEKPIKQVQTRHAGQQGLAVRSDGRIFATAGWDSRARVYSAKTMKELAVLKWHKDGCYAIAFAKIISPAAEQNGGVETSKSTEITTVQSSSTMYRTVEQARNENTRITHWLAAGAKDGKVSLWDIY